MITEKKFKEVARKLGCDVAAIKAVAKVEAPRGPFDSKGRLTCLFEPHIFWKALRRKGYSLEKLRSIQSEYPTLLSPVWNSKLYGRYSQQYDKLMGASNIDIDAAYESASYGMFQILGANYKAMGFNSALDMVEFLKESADNHLEIFRIFVEVNYLDDELREKDWKGFARGYNGKYYWKNKYDVKLEQAYKSFL